MAVARLRAGQEFEPVTPAGRRLCGWTWAGRGAPLVFLHGLLDCGAAWCGMARSLRRRSIALDLPGFGGSDLPTRPRISDYAEVVTWALDELDVSEVVLVGHSLGGALATAVAERAPERIGSLVLLAPAGFGRIHMAEADLDPRHPEPDRRHAPARAGQPARAHGRLHDDGHRRPAARRRDAPAPHAPRIPGHARRPRRHARRRRRRPVHAGFHGRRVAFDGPVVALWGDRDRLVPLGHADGVRHALPQAVVHVSSGMGHHPQTRTSRRARRAHRDRGHGTVEPPGDAAVRLMRGRTEHRPRYHARRRPPLRLFASTLPTAEPYAADRLPTANRGDPARPGERR
jgi:pimeloyl-ACP methyl ester carboxylesterase